MWITNDLHRHDVTGPGKQRPQIVFGGILGKVAYLQLALDAGIQLSEKRRKETPPAQDGTGGVQAGDSPMASACASRTVFHAWRTGLMKELRGLGARLGDVHLELILADRVRIEHTDGLL